MKEIEIESILNKVYNLIRFSIKKQEIIKKRWIVYRKFLLTSHKVKTLSHWTQKSKNSMKIFR